MKRRVYVLVAVCRFQTARRADRGTVGGDHGQVPSSSLGGDGIRRLFFQWAGLVASVIFVASGGLDNDAHVLDAFEAFDELADACGAVREADDGVMPSTARSSAALPTSMPAAVIAVLR